MKLRILTILMLVTIYISNAKAQRTISVEGYVTATETGLPVPLKEVTFMELNGMGLATAYSNQSGYYIAQMNITTSDSSSFVYASVTDCSQSAQVQEILINTQTYYTADFEICTLNNNCQASFFYQQNPGNQLMIGFENLSFPVSYSTFWFWDFGDGQTSTDFEPVHEYAQPGTYTVCLTMVDSMAGCTSVFCLDVWIAENPGECQALFTWFPEGISVAFTDLSIGKPDNWLWNFGDGTSSGEQNPVHSWNSPGTFQVCLTIFNDSTQCQDTFCDYITIGDTLPTCHADYTYQQIEGLTFAFTNLSTGLIDQVIWDFGDGTPFSHEYNATHTWEQPGIYHVCLAITSNFTSCSDVLCMYITVGDTLSGCQAAFTALVDSIPGNINHYWFIDESTGPNISSWYWDFGDGTISFIQHPDHTFAESGTYNVCLTASGTGNGGYCSSTICQTINTPSYSNLGGQIFAGDFPINNPDFINDVARVRLYRKSGNNLTEVASGQFYEYGYYFFLDVPEGNYVTHAELVPGSPSFMSFVPGYTGVTDSWLTSQQINLNGVDFYDAHIHMTEMLMPESGPGSITGNIVGIDNMPLDLFDRIIFLYHNDSIVSYDHTDAYGNFEFFDLPLTNYSLRAEIAGKYSNIVEVNLSGTQIQMSGIQLEISSSQVYGVNDSEKPDAKEIIIYPNPVREYLTISLISPNFSEFVCEVITAAGSVLLRQDFAILKGENKLALDLQPFSPGFYIIQLKNQEGTVIGTKKFIKNL